MKVIIIVGSLGRPSCTATLSNLLAQSLTSFNITTEIILLSNFHLAVNRQISHKLIEPKPLSKIQKFLTKMQTADGIVLATPVYHGSYSALLKNAIDYLPYAAFKNKPVAVLVNAGSHRACLSAASHLDAVIRALHGYSLRYQINTATNDFLFNESQQSYTLINNDILERCKELACEMHKFLNFCQLNAKL